SLSWRVRDRVDMGETPARLGDGEAPNDRCGGGIARRHPGGRLRLQRGAVWQAPVQALPRQHTEFEFGHVQPTAMLGRVVNLEALPEPEGLRGWEGLVQCPGG